MLVLVGGEKRTYQAGSLLGHLAQRCEEQAEAGAREDPVEEPGGNAPGGSGICRRLAGDQPDAREGGDHAHPHERAGALTGQDRDGREHQEARQNLITL